MGKWKNFIACIVADSTKWTDFNWVQNLLNWTNFLDNKIKDNGNFDIFMPKKYLCNTVKLAQ